MINAHDIIYFKTENAINTLRRLEQVWFEIVFPAFESLEEAAEFISDKEFFGTYSREQAEHDPHYDARRILQRDWNFYATHDELQSAQQSTLHSFFIVLSHVIEQHLIDLIHRLDQSKSSKPYSHFRFALKDLRSFDIDVNELRTWPAISNLRSVANYLKHGVGSSSTQNQIQEFLAQATSNKEADELGDNENCLLSDAGPYLPNQPLTISTDALTQEMLRSSIENACQFFIEIGKKHI